MSERLRASDLALLTAETPRTPMQNATLEIFEPGDSGFDYDALIAHIADRITFVPRYRQAIRTVPGRLANPVWVDDPDFDLGYHVRRSALPRPGTLDQLRELTARIMSRRLDPSRPLWEVYFVEGLEDGRVAVLSKSHQILVDGIATVDLGQVLLDVDPGPRHLVPDDWRPDDEPSQASLVLGAIADTARDPRTVLTTAGSVLGRVGTLAAGALSNRRPTPDSPFNVEPSEQRRVVLVRTALKDYRRVRRVHGGTVNDVILATLTGAIRSWLMTRAESVNSGRRIKALVPMSVIDEDLEPTSLGSQVIGHRLDLPIGEASPIIRLHQVSYAFKAHSETGRAVAADRIAGVAGFAPTTFHALGSRVAVEESQGVNLVITNVPGPQFPMFMAGAEMTETYPVPPLQPGFAIAIGVTSYDGGVYYGITADRDILPDVDVLGACVRESLDELVDSSSDNRPRAPRGRKK
ncbi:wax ester/triacylglycerol synthase family O-acyltransferase [Nocardioides marmoriginsengisoli]|uniref:Diacylglycerol O-acyltransferase n=1 Tax=Nocardioides marmoriginsengisoli TaxID=661483 RepID=A0A3N0CI15_9ACTN|nr:wax ester/triacylglycerol synthase family O-acyltransferase [Nocardioides marmoriginsengisoli]RNL63070.1 wax ester/triacylglycerol synthase family O-acyltransferase [Nocardioides marmoriginsengisoli]